MANEIRQKSRTLVQLQGNTAALTAGEDPNSGSYTGDTPVTLDNTFDGGSENGLGADYLQLELDVTTAPGSTASAEVWFRGSNDDINYTRWKYSHTIGDDILTSAARYDGGVFELTYQYTDLAIVARTAGFNANLNGVPVLPEVQ